MIHDEKLAAGLAHAAHLVRQARRMRGDGHHVHRHHLVEAVVGKPHVLGIHQPQGHYLVQPPAATTRAGARQHFRGEIYAGNLDMTRIKQQGKAGAHADLENAVTGAAAQAGDDFPAPGLEHGPEIKIIGRGVTPIDFLNGIDIHAHHSSWPPFCPPSADARSVRTASQASGTECVFTSPRWRRVKSSSCRVMAPKASRMAT